MFDNGVSLGVMSNPLNFCNAKQIRKVCSIEKQNTNGLGFLPIGLVPKLLIFLLNYFALEHINLFN